MNRLSIQERDTALQDIYGIAQATVTETPELVQQGLEQLEEGLAGMTSKSALDRALYVSPDSVRDSTFRLKFLRGTLFHAPKAASRMVRHFEKKSNCLVSNCWPKIYESAI
jgi:hypothetical protein